MHISWHLKFAMVRTAILLLKTTGWYEGYFNHWRTFFDYAEKRGLHILPVHHYTPLPNTSEIDDKQWGKKRHLPAIDLRIEEAVKLLSELLPRFKSECETFLEDRSADPHEYSLRNNAFGRGDADVLYSIIRNFKPVRIIEIGSGHSTLLICKAIRKNLSEATNNACEFITIEPYPPAFLLPPPSEVTRLLPQFVQDVPLSEFQSLKANDILFIDSSHTVKMGSDTLFEILSILPMLSPGVLVHVHDIFTPFDYPKNWIMESRFFWNEQYMLEAFLSFNAQFEVILPLHAAVRAHPELFLSHSTIDPSVGSFWIRRIE